MSQDAMIQELFERERIKETTHRYCYLVDRGTIDELMELFADPSDLVMSPDERLAGKAAVRQWYDGYIKGRPEVLRHLIHNQIITLDGEGANKVAHVKSYWDAVADLKGEAITGAGFYEDTLRQFNGEWKFTEKRISADFLVLLKDGWGGDKMTVQPWW